MAAASFYLGALRFGVRQNAQCKTLAIREAIYAKQRI